MTRSFLILTHYYLPEIGAPQNRLSSLAKGLINRGHKVEILCPNPNYPKNKIYDNYKNIFYQKELMDGITVHRTWVFTSPHRTFIKRLLNYFSFNFSSLFAINKINKPDYIICESPPLFLAINALLIKKIFKSKLVFNVSDLWPESAEILGIVRNKIVLNICYKLEKFIYQKSNFVLCQTRGIMSSISNRYPDVDTIWFPNGIDTEILNSVKINNDWKKKYKIEEKKIFIYAGIIGFAQGLEILIKSKKYLDDNHNNISEKIQFLIIGDGPEKEKLFELDKRLKTNCIFLDGMPKPNLLSIIKSCEAFVVPLKKNKLFEGAIPSKIFDPLSLSIPVLLGVNGEAKSIFFDESNSVLHYKPDDFKDLSDKILCLLNDESLRKEIILNGKRLVNTKFDRSFLINNLLEKIDL